jgi:bifunctional non-homologous end joining protein LigD
VATPLSWDEVGPRLDPRRFTVKTVPRRAEGPDPWKGRAALAQRLPREV